ncbi:hypothetical protein NQZ68_020575 [Dissostichus eleginoides]|nr:hypothetical protein NQZ68_020575 [Dissostichus eleginoides]
MEASVPELSWVPAAGGGGGRGGGRMLRATAGSVEQRDEEQEDEAEEELRDGGVPFYVNRGGLPVDEETWERIWRHVARIHPNGEALGKETRGATDLPKIPIPSVPTFQPTTTIPQRLEAIQKYIRELQYPLTTLVIAKDPRFERLPCTHKGTYADDCLVQRVTQHKCYILATVDRDLKRRVRKIPGVPIMYISNHRFNIERMPDDYGAPRF